MSGVVVVPDHGRGRTPRGVIARVMRRPWQPDALLGNFLLHQVKRLWLAQ
ncbi:hypothetical protein [Streptomyces amritsarensis]